VQAAHDVHVIAEQCRAGRAEYDDDEARTMHKVLGRGTSAVHVEELGDQADGALRAELEVLEEREHERHEKLRGCVRLDVAWEHTEERWSEPRRRATARRAARAGATWSFVS
jgi:hypothetical protein